MPTEIVVVAEESPEGGYTARALGFSIFTEVETLKALHASVRDAVHCHFEDGVELTPTESIRSRPERSAPSRPIRSPR